MSKHFPIAIEVEELMLGKVMRLLNRTPGVVKFNLDLTRERPVEKSNGTAHTRGTFQMSGATAVLTALREHACNRAQLSALFLSQGRAAHSLNSVLYNLRTKGMIKLGKQDRYRLTAKGLKQLKGSEQ